MFLGGFFYTFVPIETGQNTLQRAYLKALCLHNCVALQRLFHLVTLCIIIIMIMQQNEIH